MLYEVITPPGSGEGSCRAWCPARSAGSPRALPNSILFGYVEELLAPDAEAGDQLACLGRGQEVEELLGQIGLDVGVPGRVDHDHAIGVEEPGVPLDGDLEVGLGLVGSYNFV